MRALLRCAVVATLAAMPLMAAGSEGGTLERPGKVYGYIRLNFQGWYYIVEADAGLLFGTEP